VNVSSVRVANRNTNEVLEEKRDPEIFYFSWNLYL